MGLLKHIVFPLLTLTYAHNVLQFMILDRGVDLLVNDGGWPSPSDPMTPWEQKLYLSMGLQSALALVFCIIGIFFEHGHYRATVAAYQLGGYAMDAWTSYQVSIPWHFSAGVSVLLLVGLIAHAMEPGFLTQDKGKEKTK